MNKEKILVGYDYDTGEVIDANGVIIATMYGVAGFEQKKKKPEKPKTDVSALVSMKDAGFTAEEIMQMKREGLI